MKIKIHPLSINKVFKGRRFKTAEYKTYETEVYYLLPKIKKVSKKNKLCMSITAGFKSRLADIDNIAKPFIDILQKKYDFNDNQIYELHLYKEIVQKKEDEYIDFNILEI